MTAYQFALVVAAPVAIMMAIFGMVVTRGTKISEFRQAWIDAQREDIAALLANAARIARAASPEKIDDAHLAFDAALARVRLRRNPNKRKWIFWKNKEWMQVLAQLDNLRAAMNAQPIDRSAFNLAHEKIIDHAGLELKKEWNRTRSGELGFKLLILLAPILILSSVFFAVGYGLLHLLGFTQPGSFTDFLPLNDAAPR